MHRASHTAHNIATSEMAAFHAGLLKRGSNGRFFAVQELISAIMIILLSKEGVVLELAPGLSRKKDHFEAEIAPLPSIYHRVAKKRTW